MDKNALRTSYNTVGEEREGTPCSDASRHGEVTADVQYSDSVGRPGWLALEAS